MRAIWESDPDPRPGDWTKHGRQFAVMDAAGNYAAFTGPKVSTWAGHKGGRFCTAQGNEPIWTPTKKTMRTSRPSSYWR